MRRFSYTGGQTIAYTPNPAPDPIAIDSVWTGTPTDEGFTIYARSTAAASMTVRYSTASNLAAYDTSALTETVDDIWTATLTGLDPDTRYYFAIAGDVQSQIGSAWTSPVDGDPVSFSIWAAGDAGHSGMDYDLAGVSNVSDAPTFDHLRELLEDGTVVGGWYLGDRHYRDSNTTTVSTRRNIWHDVISSPKQYALQWQGWMMHTWDDHDYCGNDSNGSSSGRAVALQVFGENVPWPFDDITDGCYYTWVRGRVRFIDLDVRARRTSNGAADNSSKTRLGATQKQWFKDTLLAATEPLIVVNVGSWIGNTTSFADGWESFSTERTELFDYFVAEGLMDRLLLVGADIHELIWDDGTNTNFATGAATPGPPYAGLAPLDAGFNDFSATAQDKYQTRRQMYGTIEFGDDGTDITVVVKGWALSASPGATVSQVFSETVGPFT